MGRIIHIQFSRSRLPRRLLKDGWWLETPPARPRVLTLPKIKLPKPTPKIRHLTLVHPGK